MTKLMTQQNSQPCQYRFIALISVIGLTFLLIGIDINSSLAATLSTSSQSGRPCPTQNTNITENGNNHFISIDGKPKSVPESYSIIGLLLFSYFVTTQLLKRRRNLLTDHEKQHNVSKQNNLAIANDEELLNTANQQQPLPVQFIPVKKISVEPTEHSQIQSNLSLNLKLIES